MLEKVKNFKKTFVGQDDVNVDYSTYLLSFAWALRGLSPRKIEITLCAWAKPTHD